MSRARAAEGNVEDKEKEKAMLYNKALFAVAKVRQVYALTDVHRKQQTNDQISFLSDPYRAGQRYVY